MPFEKEGKNIFKEFSDHLKKEDKESKIHRTKFNEFLDSGLWKEKDKVLVNTSYIQRVFDNIPLPLLEFLITPENKANVGKLFQEETLDKDISNKFFQQLTVMAASSILTPYGKLQPQVIRFFEEYDKDFSKEKYRKLSQKEQQDFNKSLVFSMIHTGITAMATPYLKEQEDGVKFATMLKKLGSFITDDSLKRACLVELTLYLDKCIRSQGNDSHCLTLKQLDENASQLNKKYNLNLPEKKSGMSDDLLEKIGKDYPQAVETVLSGWSNNEFDKTKVQPADVGFILFKADASGDALKRFYQQLSPPPSPESPKLR